MFSQQLLQAFSGSVSNADSRRRPDAPSAGRRITPSAVDEEFAHADHYVFCSNEAQVIREMNTFMLAFL